MRKAVVIVNTGSPDAPTPEAVEDYLRRFLLDPRICPMNPKVWTFILEKFILPKRSAASARKYASIWTEDGSPLDTYMGSLARKLEAACKEDGIAFVLHAASYSSPCIEKTLATCRDKGCDSVMVVPLYPQSAFSTTAAVRDKAQKALASLQWDVNVQFVESYWISSAYIKAIATSIEHAGFDPEKGDRLLFAFHSIPLADIRAGDAYDEQTLCTAKNVASTLHLDEHSWRIGYQCRFDKTRSWLSPFTSKALEDLIDAKRVFVIAPNFSIDCLETLYDIDQELQNKWVELRNEKALSALGTFQYIPCLNDSDAHIEVLRSVVLSSANASPIQHKP